jgi:ribonuclease HI
MTEQVIIYADGACKSNGKDNSNGGWGAILSFKGVEKEICGGERNTTNNRMELMAVINALELLKRPCPVKLCCDSKYVLDGASSWMKGWKQNGWKTASKQPVKNEDLWRRLDEAMNLHDIEFVWIKGHVGHPGNEKADSLANKGYYQMISESNE